MTTFYLVCAALGGTLLVLQSLSNLLGLGHDHDTDAGGHDVHVGDHDTHFGDHGGFHHGHDHHGHDHHGSSWFVGLLTFRTLTAAATFFGLAGMAGTSWGWEGLSTLLFALACGVGALVLVGWMMQSLYRMRADGTARIERAIGKNGSVYLRVPGQREGAGKVTLSLQNRTVEYRAVTPAGALPTGTRVTVVAVVGPDTVEVVPADQTEGIAHA